MLTSADVSAPVLRRRQAAGANFAACQKAPTVQRVILKSTSEIYGSHPHDPVVFTEDSSSRRPPGEGFARDSIDIEGYARGLGRRLLEMEFKPTDEAVLKSIKEATHPKQLVKIREQLEPKPAKTGDKPVVAEAKTGDLVIFKVGRVFSHGAIVVAWPQIIHSHLKSRMVTLGNAERDADLVGRPARCFSYWGASDGR